MTYEVIPNNIKNVCPNIVSIHSNFHQITYDWRAGSPAAAQHGAGGALGFTSGEMRILGVSGLVLIQMTGFIATTVCKLAIMQLNQPLYYVQS